jgi:hypothetical protein
MPKLNIINFKRTKKQFWISSHTKNYLFRFTYNIRICQEIWIITSDISDKGSRRMNIFEYLMNVEFILKKTPKRSDSMNYEYIQIQSYIKNGLLFIYQFCPTSGAPDSSSIGCHRDKEYTLNSCLWSAQSRHNFRSINRNKATPC